MGLDFEGLSPLRTAAPYIRAKQLLLQLQMSAQEKYASPIIWIEDEQGDTSDAERFVSIWDSLSATDFACITGRKGQKATILHPSSSMPDYEPKLRYLDEQILLPLSSEGALIGTQDHGSYALSEVKDSQHMRVAIYIAQIIQDALHGANNTKYTGVTQKIIDHAFGGPIHLGAYPTMAFSLGEEEVPLQDILAAAQAGLIEVTPEVRAHVMERLKLPVSTAQPRLEAPADASNDDQEEGVEETSQDIEQEVSA